MHAGRRERCVLVDATDQRVWMRAAHERNVQQAGECDVVDEAAIAAQQRLVFKAFNAGADQGRHGVAQLAPLSSPAKAVIQYTRSLWVAGLWLQETSVSTGCPLSRA